jgi:hypothetical protein
VPYKLAIALAVAVAVVALTGCGGSSKKAVPPDIVVKTDRGGYRVLGAKEFN